MPMNTWAAVAVVPGLLSLAGSAYMLLAAHAVRRFARRPRAPSPGLPPVTVLKPLCGDEPGLYENLRSFCDLEAGGLQVVFGLREAGDPAAAVVRRLVAERPGRDLELVIDGRVHGANLKVSNLINLLAAARHDVLVIADSDIRVGPGYLEAAAGPLSEASVGLVTCAYVGRPVPGFWPRLGAMFVNHGFLPSVLVAERLGARGGCFGATLALRRDTLAEAGGFEPLRDLLADDYALGAAVRATGRRVVLAARLVETVVAETGPRALLRHELRWLRTIRAVEPWGYAGLLLTHPLPLAVLALLPAAGAWPAWAVLAVACACRFALVACVDRELRLPRSAPLLVLLRDLASFVLFVRAFLGRHVDWRAQSFAVGADGALVPQGGPRA